MSLLKADIPPARSMRPFDPSPLRRPAVTPQWRWAHKYLVEQRYLQRTQFLGFTKFKIVSRERRGTAELFRMIFNYAGIPYEDVILQNVDWKSLICKTPYGNLPVLWMDHNMYGEPSAIIRLLARHLQLMGMNHSEMMVAEAVLEQVIDLKESEILQKAFLELQTRADDNAEQAFQVLLPRVFDSWERHLEASLGYFILSSGFSIADMAMFDFLSQYRAYLPLDNLLVQRKHLCRHLAAVERHPMLKGYFQKYNGGGKNPPDILAQP
ncbi:glutathione S-transferase 1 [Aplysia californica]|uniref:Glutathione S-transferase 1 n=1 Tax=Aplysia californica TaxID=6500 RepID=A0ABM1A599_APLCA|nr:glutathione S-transferase 1 [Aplysia californica]